MAAAAKLALVPDVAAGGALSVAEEYAQLSGKEILAASQETSRIYNGKVLAHAVVLVQCRIRCLSLSELAKLIGVGRVTIYRYASGKPMADWTFRKSIRDLAALLAEEAR